MEEGNSRLKDENEGLKQSLEGINKFLTQGKMRRGNSSSKIPVVAPGRSVLSSPLTCSSSSLLSVEVRRDNFVTQNEAFVKIKEGTIGMLRRKGGAGILQPEREHNIKKMIFNSEADFFKRHHLRL